MNVPLLKAAEYTELCKLQGIGTHANIQNAKRRSLIDNAYSKAGFSQQHIVRHASRILPRVREKRMRTYPEPTTCFPVCSSQILSWMPVLTQDDCNFRNRSHLVCWEVRIISTLRRCWLSTTDCWACDQKHHGRHVWKHLLRVKEVTRVIRLWISS